jgi:chemotaxis protein methyltransferase CheR
MNDSAPASEPDLQRLLESIYTRFHHDFRGYALPSLRRRISLVQSQLGCASLEELRAKVVLDERAFATFVQVVSVGVTEMFRDPPFFLGLRQQVTPELSTYPSLKIWVAGCSTGEEVYSLAILLKEEGLLDRTLIYATDINPDALARAKTGIYSFDRVAAFSRNYFESGGKLSLAQYYSAGYGAAIFDRSLLATVVFSDHSLATDSVFAEVQVVICRNVLIYFGRALQDRAVELFREALCRRGFLGLGSKETVQFSAHEPAFRVLRPGETWYQRR